MSRLLLIIFMLFSSVTFACTGIVLKTVDGVSLPGRTMEFGFDIKSNIIIFPKGSEINFLSSDKKNTGLKFKTKYGFLGMDALGMDIVVDGINDQGLYYGAFYFSGFAKYDSLTEENKSKAVSSEELGNYILGNFKSVEEIKKGLKNISVVGTYIKAINSFAPVHYAVTDKSGKSIVIEYTQAGLKIHDNTINVVCNNPTYDWHLTNIRNYVFLSSENRSAMNINGQKYAPLAQGTGLLGIPGDFTSPSRFIRAAAFINSTLPSKNAEEGVFRGFHILNSFDIPKGAIREKVGEQLTTDYTVWTSLADTKNLIYYFKTYKNPDVKKIDLVKALSQANSKRVKLPSEYEWEIKELSIK